MLLEPVTQYYRLNYRVGTGENGFDFSVILADGSGNYTATGDEFGNGAVPGREQLVAIAEGIATGIEAKSPVWGQVVLVGIDAHPVGMLQIPVTP